MNIENKDLNRSWKLVNFCEFDKYAIQSYCAIHSVDESLKKLRELCIDENIKGFQIKNPPYAFNVGAMLDYMDFTPRTLDEILKANEVQKENK